MNPDEKRSGEAGMVTVEIAIALAASILVVTALILAITVASARGEACQIAREAARSYSLGASAGGSGSGVGGEVRTGTGRSATVEISGGDPWFTASASIPGLQLGPWTSPLVNCEVTAIREPYLQWEGSG